MPELAARLRVLRAELVETMASELAADGNWLAWVSLLAEIETAIQACQATMEEESSE